VDSPLLLPAKTGKETTKMSLIEKANTYRELHAKHVHLDSLGFVKQTIDFLDSKWVPLEDAEDLQNDYLTCLEVLEYYQEKEERRELEVWDRITNLIENQNIVIRELVEEKHIQNELKRRELNIIEQKTTELLEASQ